MADITEKYKGRTEGNWKISSAGDGVFSEDGQIIAYGMFASNRDSNAIKANIKLIADAPLILSQLNEAVELLQIVDMEYDQVMRSSDTDAIAKFLNSIGGE